MQSIMIIILGSLIGYICGSTPFGWLYVRAFKGIDLREVGSGRTGGTNSMRAGGFWVGFLTSVSDVLKGAAAIWLARVIAAAFGGDPELLPWYEICAGIAAVIGHNWSVFLRFRGGAGTGPNVGWSAALWWPMFPLALVMMPGVMVVTGMASVASMVMGLIITIVFVIRYAMGLDPTVAYIVGGFVTFLIVVWALRPNIRRILDGTERLVGPRAKRKQAASE